MMEEEGIIEKGGSRRRTHGGKCRDGILMSKFQVPVWQSNV